MLASKDNLEIYQSATGIWRGVKAALAEQPLWERCIFIFWLMGPLVLLIERTPADLWLSLLSLAFIARSVKRRNWSFLNDFWVRSAFLFLFVCIVSALLSELPAYSLGETAAWFRFPLFAMATVFWFAADRRFLYAMLVMTGLGMFLMCGILVAELLFEGQKGGRLTWPYGDLVPGGYLSKVGMPAFLILVALTMSHSRLIASYATLAVLINLGMSVSAGERVNLILRVCSAAVAVVAWRFKRGRAALILLGFAVAIMLAASLSPVNTAQLTRMLYEGVASGFESDYISVVGGGYAVFEQAVALGIGPGNYRFLAGDMLVDMPHLRADNHPHNFYLQMLAETGVVGAFAGTVFLWSVVWKCFKARARHPKDIVVAVAFIIPFGMFWPVTTTADFFGQWNNIFMWSAVALALAMANSHEKEGHITEND